MLILIDDDSEKHDDSCGGKKLTEAQKEAIERNRRKAEELRARKRPPSHIPGTYGSFLVIFINISNPYQLNAVLAVCIIRNLEKWKKKGCGDLYKSYD